MSQRVIVALGAAAAFKALLNKDNRHLLEEQGVFFDELEPEASDDVTLPLTPKDFDGLAEEPVMAKPAKGADPYYRQFEKRNKRKHYR